MNAKVRHLFSSPKVRIGAIVVLVYVLMAIFAPVLAPHDPLEVDVINKLAPPDKTYPLGTDQLGRCVFSRLIWGSRISLTYSLIVLALTLLIGVSVGLVAGYAGGRTDNIIMRIIDVFMAMPSMIVVLAIAGTLGANGTNMVFAMSLVYWAEYARITRAMTLSVREKNYIMALRAGGTKGSQILFRHILKNISPSIISLATMEIGSIILAIAGFSFMGIGVQAPTPEWGVMLSDSRNFIQVCPRLMFIPGITVMIAVLAFNFLGEGLQDVFAGNKSV